MISWKMALHVYQLSSALQIICVHQSLFSKYIQKCHHISGDVIDGGCHLFYMNLDVLSGPI